jgi:hypothetical protein
MTAYSIARAATPAFDNHDQGGLVTSPASVNSKAYTTHRMRETDRSAIASQSRTLARSTGIGRGIGAERGGFMPSPIGCGPRNRTRFENSFFTTLKAALANEKQVHRSGPFGNNRRIETGGNGATLEIRPGGRNVKTTITRFIGADITSRPFETGRWVSPRSGVPHPVRSIRQFEVMPATCSICRNEARDEINSALLGSGSLRDIAGRFGVAKSSLDRHRRKCLHSKVATALARYEEIDGKRLVADLLGLREHLAAGVLRTSAAKEYGALVALSGQQLKTIEMIGRLIGVLGDGGSHVSIDARKQVAVLANLSERELRALASAALDASASDALGSPLASDVVQTSFRPVPRRSGLAVQVGASPVGDDEAA